MTDARQFRSAREPASEVAADVIERMSTVRQLALIGGRIFVIEPTSALDKRERSLYR